MAGKTGIWVSEVTQEKNVSYLCLLQAEEIFFTYSALVLDIFLLTQLSTQPRETGLKCS